MPERPGERVDINRAEFLEAIVKPFLDAARKTRSAWNSPARAILPRSRYFTSTGTIVRERI
jgi:glucuronate isomerase